MNKSIFLKNIFLKTINILVENIFTKNKKSILGGKITFAKYNIIARQINNYDFFIFYLSEIKDAILVSRRLIRLWNEELIQFSICV